MQLGGMLRNMREAISQDEHTETCLQSKPMGFFATIICDRIPFTFLNPWKQDGEVIPVLADK